MPASVASQASNALSVTRSTRATEKSVTGTDVVSQLTGYVPLKRRSRRQEHPPYERKNGNREWNCQRRRPRDRRASRGGLNERPRRLPQTERRRAWRALRGGSDHPRG